MSYWKTPEGNDRRKMLLAAEGRAEDPLDKLTTEQLEALAYRSVLGMSGHEDERETLILTADAAGAFVNDATETQGYIACDRNGKLMLKEIERLGLDSTDVNSYHQAFNSLNSDGLLEINQDAVEKFSQDVAREHRATRVRTVGAMSAKRSAPEPVRNDAPDTDNMSLEDLKMLAWRSLE